MRMRDLGYWTWCFLGKAILKELVSTQGSLVRAGSPPAQGLLQVPRALVMLWRRWRWRIFRGSDFWTWAVQVGLD